MVEGECNLSISIVDPKLGCNPQLEFLSRRLPTSEESKYKCKEDYQVRVYNSFIDCTLSTLNLLMNIYFWNKVRSVSKAISKLSPTQLSIFSIPARSQPIYNAHFKISISAFAKVFIRIISPVHHGKSGVQNAWIPPLEEEPYSRSCNGSWVEIFYC